MMASAQRYRLLASLVSVALALLYSLIATGNARADELNPAGDSGLNSALQAADAATSAGAGDVPAPVDQSIPAAASQEASTAQAAGAAATGTQQQPRNLVISVRINSPGNDGPISQTNVAGSGAGTSNDSSTGQVGAAGGQQASQQAATDQGATATATATQDQPQNIVIVIRISSPGDNGPIEQPNTAAAVSNAGNVSSTTQGESGIGSADESATGASPDTRAAIGPPAQQQAATPAGALPRMSVALPAPVAPRTAIATGHRVDRPAPAARSNHPPADDRAKSAPSTGQTVSSQLSDPAPAAKSGTSERLIHVKPARESAAARGAAIRDAGVGRRAVEVLGRFAPRSPLQARGSEKDVTGAVVFTLIAVLGAFLVFLGSTYLSSGLRLFAPRSWRHG